MSQEVKIQNPCLYSFFSEYKLAKNVNKSQDGCWMWLWKVDFAWSERFWQSPGISSWHQQNPKYEPKFPNSLSPIEIQMMTKVLLLWLDTHTPVKRNTVYPQWQCTVVNKVRKIRILDFESGAISETFEHIMTRTRRIFGFSLQKKKF